MPGKTKQKIAAGKRAKKRHILNFQPPPVNAVNISSNHICGHCASTTILNMDSLLQAQGDQQPIPMGRVRNKDNSWLQYDAMSEGEKCQFDLNFRLERNLRRTEWRR